MYNKLKDKLLARLFDFLHQPSYLTEVEDLYKSFLEKIEITEEVPEYLYQWFVEVAVFDYYFSGEQTLVELFLNQQGKNLTAPEKQILTSWIGLPLSVYEVEEYDSEFFYFVDLIRNEKFIVAKRDYNIIPGELVITRVGEIGDKHQMVGSFDILPAMCQSIVEDKIEVLLIDFSNGLENNINQFLKKRSIELISLWERLQGLLLESFPEQLGKPGKIYEASYRLQSKKLAIKKLTSHQDIELYQSNSKLKILLWYETDEPVIKGEFFITPDQLWFRTYSSEDLLKGKKLVTELLSFVVQFKEEYTIDNQSTAVTENELPREKVLEEVSRKLSENFEAKKKSKEDLLKKMELDEIERLIVNNMEDEFSEDAIYEAVFLWRDYKETVEQGVKGESRNWAAGLEYLICQLNYWDDSPQKIAAKYKVSTEAVARKCRKITKALKL